MFADGDVQWYAMKDAGSVARKQADSVVKHYATLAYEYDRKWDRYTRVSLGTLVQHLDLHGDEHLLDTACGTGRLAEMIREKTPNVRITGTDLSPDMIDVARQRHPEDESTAWQVDSTEELPFEDATFDVVTCANAFHLIPDQEKAMREMRRLVKPGGTVCIVDWCREYLQIHALLRLTRLFGRQHRIILTREELRAMMERAGLTVTHTSIFKATAFWGLMVLTAKRDEP